nr:reverse transcriptase domain-containing protein [Tanacetum cinerariifolium]
MQSQQSTKAFVKETFMDLKTQLETIAKNHQASIQNLETKFERLADKQSGRPSGSLPTNTQPNSKGHNSKSYQPPQAQNEHVTVVFIKGGKSYNPPVNLNDQQNDFENIINFDSDDEEDQEPTSQSKTKNPKPIKETPLPKPYKPKIPIDVIDEILEEDFDALIEEGSKILYSIEGTLLGEEIFAEFDKFMAMTADINSDSESDTEDPPFKKITINTYYKIKTSVEEPPTDLELKSLLDNLEYVFLEEPSFLPVIISSQLSKEKENKLISVLKKHKRAFSWKTTDILGICPSFCKHKIQLLDNKKPLVQKQRRLNPNMQEVVKKEIMKLLDTGIIYPIADSPWVSHVHCIPKKGSIIVVTNENDELVPTRIVTGWRVCIDYHKLNEATRKDHFPLPSMDQMLERLAGNKYFYFLDCFSGYFQIPIDPNDQKKTTFTCPFDAYAYKRMLFGLCNARATFQRCMLAIFHDMIEESVKRCFIKDARPLTKLLEKDTPFEFDDELGAVLGQKDGKNFHPVYFASKTLNPAQQKYTVTEKELMAIIFAFDKFKSNLILSKTIVHTDHSALRHSFKSKMLNHTLFDGFYSYKNLIYKSKKEKVQKMSLLTTYPESKMMKQAMTVKSMITFLERLLWKSTPKMNLVDVDYVSKWAEAQALPTNDARVVVTFLKKLFCHFRMPKALISGRGPYVVKHQYPSGYVELYGKDGKTFIVNGHRLKLYHEEDNDP